MSSSNALGGARRFGAIAVFCGSSPGRDPTIIGATVRLGRMLAERDVRLVYGGGRVGLMGVLADAVLDGGGTVHGVITRALLGREIAHEGLTELEVVGSMHDRKARMADAADGFVMLPGGFGTLDEFFEAVTWSQLGVHDKPCGILDVAGYFGPLLDFVQSGVSNRFIRPEHAAMVVVADDPVLLIDRMETWTAPATSKWLDRTER
jgi:uncharacterized protein (TIGR00730 family)